MRAIGLSVLLVFLAHVLVPAGIVMDFLVEQERIAEELCVQRLVPDEMRTCHGHCYLSKKLKEVDARERDLPGTLRALKLDDALPEGNALPNVPVVPALGPLAPDAAADVLAGLVPVIEHVPWC